MLQDICADAKGQMEKALDALRKHLASIRTGRANISLLDGVRVDYYGSPSPVAQVASVSVLDPRTLLVKAWEKAMLKPIEKAVMEAGLGLVPINDGDVIRIPLPALTEERRREFVKQARNRGEEAKLAIRNARRDANELLKEATKSSDISEDDEKRGLKMTQEITDHSTAEVDKLLAHKEAEIMTV